VTSDAGPRALLGRDREQQTLNSLLDGARSGRSGVVVVRGEPGIGKTALLAQLSGTASDFDVVRITGAESELDLTWSGIEQLCSALRGHLPKLPPPQLRAIQAAIGLLEAPVGTTPDPLLIGLATLTLIAEAGRRRPTLFVVDDAQWVDSPSLQAFAIAARRLLAEQVAMVFAVRDHGAERILANLPELELQGLDRPHSEALLSAAVPWLVDERIRETLLAEARGNPLALLELHKSLHLTEMATSHGLGNVTTQATGIEMSFHQQLQQLPAATRTLLLIAAAEPAGSPEWIWAAARRLGIDATAAEPAETAQLIRVDNGIRFRHPLVRSALYRFALASERRRAHAALSLTAVPGVADQNYAWHRAQAASGPDEKLAGELARASVPARARGGAAVAAAFHARAAELTRDRNRRRRWLLAAAAAALDAGASAAATQFIAQANGVDDNPGDTSLAAQTALLRARLALSSRRGRDAPALLLAAAEGLRTVDPSTARETYLHALMAALFVGHQATDSSTSASAIAEAARHAPDATEPPRAIDLLLDALVVRLTGDYAAAAPIMQKALDAYLREDSEGVSDPRWHAISHIVSLDLFDLPACMALVTNHLQKLRAAGNLTILATALFQNAGLSVYAGRLDQAMMFLEEADALIAATGTPAHGSIRPLIAAYRGQEQLCLTLVESVVAESMSRGEGGEVTVALCAKAALHNGLGQYAEAFDACDSLPRFDEVGYYGYTLVEKVEAASRCGQVQVAREAAGRIAELADSSRTALGLGLAARCAALVHETDGTADALYREALDRLQHSPAIVYLARTHLVYGEWLRRMKRRAEAGAQLRTAYDMFTRMGADGFARRARRELTATGEKVVTHAPRVANGLTTQETQIAILARDGFTNNEIASQLFLSPRTVEWHLGHIFNKLGVSSRRSLRGISLS
jgi:DNA-binding CsgD family transcriptional regulator